MSASLWLVVLPRMMAVRKSEIFRIRLGIVSDRVSTRPLNENWMAISRGGVDCEEALNMLAR